MRGDTIDFFHRLDELPHSCKGKTERTNKGKKLLDRRSLNISPEELIQDARDKITTMFTKMQWRDQENPNACDGVFLSQILLEISEAVDTTGDFSQMLVVCSQEINKERHLQSHAILNKFKEEVEVLLKKLNIVKKKLCDDIVIIEVLLDDV